ncbi:proline and serine-rich protein 3 isoform X2 [Mugil cephalus]|uniref:proline and serine-rich protein 3 isoform X2 n=1 Tax=Mugil cephalus TaxID=48193 RepID=UPI001FB73BA8|nr:proline and serine-rich protein 3 isoform X2 [Mugil cephalus]
MKSSGSVFTRQNPFPPASTGRRAHYHPSRKQAISKKEKKTTPSPVRSKQRSSPHLHARLDRERDHHFSSTDGRPGFDEYWPSTDGGASPDSNQGLSDMEAPKQPVTVASAPGGQQDSVLAKYIERFRRGRPQSREERQQMSSAVGEEERVPFWWASDSSLPASSTPTKTTDKGDHSPARRHQRERSLSPCGGSLSILSDASQSEFDDAEILHLQERANRLLLRGEYTVSDGSNPVSSEGLGGSDFSSPVTVDEPARRPAIASLLRASAGMVSSDSVHAVTVPPTRPEEDILFQWRLRRKMEQAREWPRTPQPSSLHGSTFSWRSPILSHPSSGGQAHEQQQRTQPSQSSQGDMHPHAPAPQQEAHSPPLPAYVVPGSSVSQPQAIAHVPAHMHLLCDVLPCPIQSSQAGSQQGVAQRLNEPQATVVDKKGTQVPPASSTNPSSDAPLGENTPSPHSALPGALGQEWPSRQTIPERNKTKKADTKEPEKNEKKTAVRQQRKEKERTCSHQRLPKKVTRCREPLRQEGNQESASESCSGDHEPPPSPIHSALGQVVSEVLFPAVDSPAAQNIPVPRVLPPHAVSTPSHSPVPPCNAQNSVEAISQLLQEAEDSDEKEFEGDPLLQVLRKQRKWVKEQISEVDSMLNEFPEGE